MRALDARVTYIRKFNAWSLNLIPILGRVDDTGDTIIDACDLECGLFEVKDESGAENVKPWQVLPTIPHIQ